MSKSGVLIFFLTTRSFLPLIVFIGGNLSLVKNYSRLVPSNGLCVIYLYRAVLFLDLSNWSKHFEVRNGGEHNLAWSPLTKRGDFGANYSRFTYFGYCVP